MNEMMYRDYRDYDNRYDNRYEDERDYDYRRDYDRRGGKINNRNYRHYRNYREDFYSELEAVTEDLREQYRKIEDVAEMAENQQEKTALTRVAQKEKENYMYLKQMMEK